VTGTLTEASSSASETRRCMGGPERWVTTSGRRHVNLHRRRSASNRASSNSATAPWPPGTNSPQRFQPPAYP